MVKGHVADIFAGTEALRTVLPMEAVQAHLERRLGLRTERIGRSLYESASVMCVVSECLREAAEAEGCDSLNKQGRHGD